MILIYLNVVRMGWISLRMMWMMGVESNDEKRLR
jgi:hypothetical protein